MDKRSPSFTEEYPATIRKAERFGARGQGDYDFERAVIRDRPAARQAITRLLSPAQAERGITGDRQPGAKEPRRRRIGKDVKQPDPVASPPPTPGLIAAEVVSAPPPALLLDSVATLGALARQQRLNLAFSQQRLADLAGVGRRFVSELESGKPSLEIGRVLTCCAALGIDLSARSRG
jgi:y4mF family transcriptional regulator